jgi:hypothetical protein
MWVTYLPYHNLERNTGVFYKSRKRLHSEFKRLHSETSNFSKSFCSKSEKIMSYLGSNNDFKEYRKAKGVNLLKNNSEVVITEPYQSTTAFFYSD